MHMFLGIYKMNMLRTGQYVFNFRHRVVLRVYTLVKQNVLLNSGHTT